MRRVDETLSQKRLFEIAQMKFVAELSLMQPLKSKYWRD